MRVIVTFELGIAFLVISLSHNIANRDLAEILRDDATFCLDLGSGWSEALATSGPHIDCLHLAYILQ